MRMRAIVVTLVLIGLIGLIAARRDERLVGIYTPDPIATHERWSFGRSVGTEGVKGVLSQIFRNQPVRMTDRALIMSGARGTETNRFWILAKGRDSCTAYFPPASVVTFEIADDGLWFMRRFCIPREKFPLVVKLSAINRGAATDAH